MRRGHPELDAVRGGLSVSRNQRRVASTLLVRKGDYNKKQQKKSIGSGRNLIDPRVCLCSVDEQGKQMPSYQAQSWSVIQRMATHLT